MPDETSPAPKDTPVTIRFTEYDRELMAALAHQLGRSAADVVRMALRAFAARHLKIRSEDGMAASPIHLSFDRNNQAEFEIAPLAPEEHRLLVLRFPGGVYVEKMRFRNAVPPGLVMTDLKVGTESLMGSPGAVPMAVFSPRSTVDFPLGHVLPGQEVAIRVHNTGTSETSACQVRLWGRFE